MDRNALCPGLNGSRDNPKLCCSCKMDFLVLGLPTYPPEILILGTAQPMSSNPLPLRHQRSWLPLTIPSQTHKDLCLHPGPSSAPNICPLLEVKGGLRCSPRTVQVPFSVQDLLQIKKDLGIYSDDPENYINLFQRLTLNFDLSCKDINIIIGQNPSKPERQLEAAICFGDDLYKSDPNYLIGAIPVSNTDPNWD